MSPLARRVVAVAAATAVPWAVNGLPMLASNDRLRRALLPGLAGLGPPGRVALTFDDGPDPASTPQFLSALDALGWKATFFLLGDMVRRAPGLAAEVVAAGHEVAVHGDRHLSHPLRTPRAVVADMARGYQAVAEATGTTPRWFRPPYGSLSAATLVGGRRLGLRTVLWSAWGRDWRADATPETVRDTVLDGLRPGATILLHDSDCTSAPGAWRSALGALPLLADELAARSVTVGPLDGHLAA
jgi:peptidoglycan/xylan/chitin deacetylase (PgdA/CDA1 family)